MHDPEDEYPPEAYAENGVLWWELDTWPGKKLTYGAERKIAAWLAFNLEEGDHFSMRQLREALGSDVVPNDDEHLNRRLRRLRPDGWAIPSNRDDKSLGVGVYRLDQIGWHPGVGERPKADNISNAMRRFVFERDGHRCVICGVAAGEPYPGKPDSSAVITVGHRKARAHQGTARDADNLETQCGPCNEPVREEVQPESVEDVLQDLRKLNKAELSKFETWIGQGYRSRDRLDDLHDRARALSPIEREQVLDAARKRLGR